MAQVYFRSCTGDSQEYTFICGDGIGLACPEENKIYRFIINNVRSEKCWYILPFSNIYPGAILVTVQYDASYPDPYDSCSECFQYNYKLINCLTSDVIYTNYLECPSCIDYINYLMYTNIEPNPCWYVTLIDLPIEPITTVMESDGYCEPCEGKCYTVTGTGVITYLDGYGEFTTTNAPAVICSSSYPSVTGTDYEIFTNNLFCDDRNPCTYTYELTNCETGVKIQSNEPDLAFPYALDQTVKLDEYPGACWTIEQFSYNRA